MKSELLDIFRVKVVAKNILLGSRRPNEKLFLQCDVSLCRNKQIFWTKLLHLSVFQFKQYTSLVSVKKKSFCLINWAFPGPCGPISCSKVAKIFFAYEGLCLRPATLLKKRLWHRCFPVDFGKFLRAPFLIEHLRWLLLKLKWLFCRQHYRKDNIIDNNNNITPIEKIMD